MKLPDFEAFEPFNQLREQMGADILLMDESFDENIHISLYERSLLDSQHLVLDLEQLSRDADYRLRFKNTNVVMLDEGLFHLAACQVVLRKNGMQKVSWKVEHETVCVDCLHQMNYEGVNLHKSRREIHNKKVTSLFDLETYWDKNPNYPLKSRKIAIF